MGKVLVLANSIGGIYSFRKELIQKLLEQRHEVIIAAPQGDKVSYFTKAGCSYIETTISRHGTNPFTDIKLLLHYEEIIKKNKPDVVLTYTIKPNIYGGFACRILHVPYITNITGLGNAIENKGMVQKIALLFYHVALKKAVCVFFQNKSNQHFFIDKQIVKCKTRLIPGSGVNLEQHCFEKYPENDDVIKFLFIGRIMKDKGINELLDAAIRVKHEYHNIQFDLVGESEENYTDRLLMLEKKGVIKYHGYQDDVHSFIKKSHAIVLPSYHEGTANVLLESGSSGRPILASNVPGCIETFDEGISGLGFEARNLDSLVEAIIKFIKLSYEQKKYMGLCVRRKMESQFNRQIVINAYLEEIEKWVKK